MTWPQANPQTPYDGNRSQWMGQLDDDLLVRDLSIPGTHDTAALDEYTHFPESTTQKLRIEEQLSAGIRFLDLRVKTKDSTQDLAMWHGGDFLFDPYGGAGEQLYFRKVMEVVADWLGKHPRETVIISVKDEGDEGVDVGRRVYDILTDVNQRYIASSNGQYKGMWHDHTVDCRLRDVRGKLVLWKRFASAGPADDAKRPGVDFIEMNSTLDNTKGTILKAGGVSIAWVQDFYGDASLKEKIERWISTVDSAWANNCLPNTLPLQFLNFGSKAGYLPSYNAEVLNPLMRRWLKRAMKSPSDTPDRASAIGGPDDWHFRSGIGVIPMDFPDLDLIDAILALNFSQSYCLTSFPWGKSFAASLADEAASKEK